jgi:hypothetical protein
MRAFVNHAGVWLRTRVVETSLITNLHNGPHNRTRILLVLGASLEVGEALVTWDSLRGEGPVAQTSKWTDWTFLQKACTIQNSGKKL